MPQEPQPQPQPQPTNDIESLKNQLGELTKLVQSLAKTPEPKPQDLEPKPQNPKPEILDKIKDDKNKIESEVEAAKKLEAAIMFSVKKDSWLKQNKTLLPDLIDDLFVQIEKENFNSPIEKDQTIKANIIQAFFGVQENLDLLTDSQKKVVDSYLKSTKLEKESKSGLIYEQVFEPTLEMLRKIKKASELNKGHETSETQDLMKQKYLKLAGQGLYKRS